MASQLRVLVALVCGAAFAAGYAFPDCVNGPLKNNTVCDTSANYLDRAKAVIALFNTTELIANTVNSSPGVARLGLPAYMWWNEALHGVAGSPGVSFAPAGQPFDSATSFPEPILMGAAFDDDLINQVASIISTEARAFNNFDHAGLDYWTPNINPFKDPRWGRGQETPGEDPLHLARYVYQLVTGLQGGVAPTPLKIVADCKHFAAYDLEDADGITRHSFNAIVTQQDLSEYYTPPFQSCVRDAKVASVMCSYNAVNGIPSCANEFLLQDVMRDHFGLGENQWIVSDCDAVGDIFSPHNYTSSLVNASALALKAGTDINCGTTFSQNLGAALSQGLITVDDLRQALTRQYASLVRLGYFDPAASQPFRQLNWANVNTTQAQQLAYQAAVEGIVLLKNSGVLPLASNVKNIALVGPWANATTQMQGNYQGTAPFLISPLQGMQAAGLNVTYVQGTAINGNSTSGFAAAVAAAKQAQAVIFMGGIDDSIEAEGNDRTTITWPGNQLDLISALEAVGKPLVVFQMGGGQVDSSSLKASNSVNALVWGGYPGQSGGKAIADIVTGKVAPAGRLPVTQYPANYVNQIQMTDMSLRPNSATGSPGRTYKWYTGQAVYEFGSGTHYTQFSASWSGKPATSYNIQQLVKSAASAAHPDLFVFDSATAMIKNTGKVASDYVALVFSNTTAGPQPAPLRTLATYTRVKNIAPGQSGSAKLDMTLGSIARADNNGNIVLYPGTYNVWLDTTGVLQRKIQLTGSQAQIIAWPQPPK